MNDRKKAVESREGIVPPQLAAEGVAIAPPEIEAEVDEALGLQLISIRLPRRLIEDLKLIAKHEGLGYQPLVRRVLVRFAQGEFRSWAHLAAGEATKKLDEHAESMQEDAPRAVACGG